MPYQRYENFTDEELHELRFGLQYAMRINLIAERKAEASICEDLGAEIGHVQEQRRMRAAREALPA